MGILRTIENAGFEPICVHFTWKGAGPWLSEKVRIGQTVEITNPVEDPPKAAMELEFLGNALLENRTKNRSWFLQAIRLKNYCSNMRICYAPISICMEHQTLIAFVTELRIKVNFSHPK